MLGPEPGRYVLREADRDDASHVLILALLGARQRGLFERRRAKGADPEPTPADVVTTRATVIAAEAFGRPEEARAWLKAATADKTEDDVRTALRVLNRAIHGHRLASANPFVHEVGREQALVVRLGLGEGPQVAEGRWSEAAELSSQPPRERRVAALRPQERLAALLGRRDEPLACEDLILRARQDSEHGRTREAALQVRVALEAALVDLEPSRGRSDMAARLDALAEQRRAIGAAANAALKGTLDDAQAQAVEHTLERLEAALRARSAAGIG